jgi:hypothetical protein
MATTRWDRLAADLRNAKIDVTVDDRSYFDEQSRTTEHSRSITFQVDYMGLVHIGDVYDRFGRWQGWQVTAEGTDSIIVGRPSAPSKNRREVIGAFGAYVTTLKRRA